MRESAIYQEWRQEALAEGIQLGKQEGIQLGKQEGIQLGKQEGIQLGKQEGIQLGKQEGIQQTARNLLAMGLDPQQIAMATELTLEQVQQLQQEYEDP